MKIATWNVNSLKVRLPHVLDWLAANQPDALCLQELKCENKAFPLAEIEAAGYQAVFNGQKTYNGVAILSRKPLADVTLDIPGFADEQKRIIAGTLDEQLHYSIEHSRRLGSLIGPQTPNMTLYRFAPGEALPQALTPIYPATAGLAQAALRKLVQRYLEEARAAADKREQKLLDELAQRLSERN